MGRSKAIFKFSHNHLDSSRAIISIPYLNLIRSLNPKVKFANGHIDADGDGFIRLFINHKLKEMSRKCYGSDNVFKKHVLSRGSYILLGASSVIARLADGILGALVAPLSFVTFGKVATINSLAIRSLQAGGMVKDVYYCAVKFINPWAGTDLANK